jgi:integrase
MIQMLMLSALRRSEVAQATWSEIDLAAQRWIIPASRMKGGAVHIVPLTPKMMAIIKALPRFSGGEFLFTSKDGSSAVTGFSLMKTKLDRLMLEELRKIAKDRGNDPSKVTLNEWRLHDIRRSVRTHLSAIAVPELVSELILAHSKPGLHQVYNQFDYFDAKLSALNQWGARLERIANPPPTDAVVVPLRA